MKRSRCVRLIARREPTLIEALVFPERVELYQRGGDTADFWRALRDLGVDLDVSFSSPCG